eukprot:TRINITY_DN7108_c0_g1_i1.p1 TRINITY_DN7108_c0_g1~~TRINITY_DN7108_c0_g1_i1.p1  ORF type:complete len:350 (+),score=74.38 TRINITY_DN7108_c0_g1_i1:74-1123(+)
MAEAAFSCATPFPSWPSTSFGPVPDCRTTIAGPACEASFTTSVRPPPGLRATVLQDVPAACGHKSNAFAEEITSRVMANMEMVVDRKLQNVVSRSQQALEQTSQRHKVIVDACVGQLARLHEEQRTLTTKNNELVQQVSAMLLQLGPQAASPPSAPCPAVPTPMSSLAPVSGGPTAAAAAAVVALAAAMTQQTALAATVGLLPPKRGGAGGLLLEPWVPSTGLAASQAPAKHAAAAPSVSKTLLLDERIVPEVQKPAAKKQASAAAASRMPVLSLVEALQPVRPPPLAVGGKTQLFLADSLSVCSTSSDAGSASSASSVASTSPKATPLSLADSISAPSPMFRRKTFSI